MNTGRVVAAFVIGSLILIGCAKHRLDEEVDRLCRIDGGVHVYESVRLPAKFFNERGVLKEEISRGRASYALGAYVVEMEDRVLVSGDPDLRRSEIRVIRTSDAKLLGKSVAYTRRGGDFPGPFHPSHFTCPPPAETGVLIQRVFVKETLNG